MTAYDLSAALKPMDVAGRTARLNEAIDANCSAFLVTKPSNVQWLTGFTGSNGAVAVTEHGLLLATDGRYEIQAEQQLQAAGVEAELLIKRDVIAALTETLSEHEQVGVESHHVTWSQQRSLAGDLASSTLVPFENLIESLRIIKDEGEIDRLRRASAMADHALKTVVSDLPEAVTERAIAQRLEAAMVDIGADGLSFPTIVAAGPNSARPHAVPSDRPLTQGDLLVIDMGANVDGYGSDMTRTFSIGPFTAATEPLYQAVLAAQAEGVATVGEGVSTVDVDAACRGVLAQHGLEEAFIHGTGHGIGLEIHESPFLSKTGTDTLQAGSVVTVEPGVYLADVGGVRIEDSVVVGVGGCDPITLSPKQPIIR